MATATLAVALIIPSTAAEVPSKSIRINSYKDNALKVGERSDLIIGPSGTDYSVISSDPDTVAMEQVLTFWVAVAKAEGTAKITASNSAGECGSITLTVNSATLTIPEPHLMGTVLAQSGNPAGDDPAHQPGPQSQ